MFPPTETPHRTTRATLAKATSSERKSTFYPSHAIVKRDFMWTARQPISPRPLRAARASRSTRLEHPNCDAPTHSRGDTWASATGCAQLALTPSKGGSTATAGEPVPSQKGALPRKWNTRRAQRARTHPRPPDSRRSPSTIRTALSRCPSTRIRVVLLHELHGWTWPPRATPLPPSLVFLARLYGWTWPLGTAPRAAVERTRCYSRSGARPIELKLSYKSAREVPAGAALRRVSPVS